MTDDLAWLKPKPQRLTNLKIREVSSVDRGAGEDVKVAFWKSGEELSKADDDDGGATSFEEEIFKLTGSVDPVGTVKANDDAIVPHVGRNDDTLTKEDDMFVIDTIIVRAVAAAARVYPRPCARGGRPPLSERTKEDLRQWPPERLR